MPLSVLHTAKEKYSGTRWLFAVAVGTWVFGAAVMFSGSVIAFVIEVNGETAAALLPWVPLLYGACSLIFGTALLAYVVLRPDWLACVHCGKSTPSNAAWICGVCDFRNEKFLVWFSFLHKCRRCHDQPVGMKCHSCGEGVLGNDGDRNHWAFEIADSAPRRVGRWEQEEQKYIEQQQRLLHKKKIELLRKELDDVKKPAAQAQEETVEITIMRMEQTCLQIGTLSAAMKRCRTMLDKLELSDGEKDRVMSRLRMKYVEKR